MPPFEHVFQQNILRTLHTTGGFNNTAEDYRCQRIVQSGLGG
jgi:hypothetical protein